MVCVWVRRVVRLSMVMVDDICEIEAVAPGSYDLR
jgi:hypothetical protein